MIQRTADKGKSGIYIIRNSESGKFYIGKAKCIYRRIKWHVTSLNTKNKNENLHMINSWHKYGRDVFSYEVLEYCDKNDEILSELEYKWMIELDAVKNGYNMRLDSGTKCILPQETKDRMSKAKIELYKDPIARAKCSHQYWSNNPEAKKNMAIAVSKATVKYSIEQYTRDNILIKTWGSVKEITDHHTEYKWQVIYAVCSGAKKTYKGFIWKKIQKMKR